MPKSSSISFAATSFAHLANAMPQLVWIAEPDGRVSYYNDRIREFHGAHQDEEGLWRWEGMLHNDDLVPTQVAWTNAVANGNVYEMEHRVLMRDGNFRWFLSRAFPQKEDGQVVRWYGTATDVDEQKKVQELLKLSEAEFRAIFEISTAGMMQVNENGSIQKVNAACSEMMGYTSEEMQGINFVDITHPDDRQESVGYFSRMKAGHKLVFEKRYVKKDGTTVWSLVNVNAIYGEDGEFKHAIAVIQDISSQKQIEQDLKKVATHLKIATDSARAGTWMYDVATQTIEWSELHKQMWGYDPGRSHLVFEDWHGPIHPDDKPHVFHSLEKAEKERTLYEAEYRITRAGDGAILWMHSFGKYIYDEKGNPVTTTGITLDITEKKKKEKELLEIKEQLELTVRNVPAGIMLLNKERTVEFANDRALAWFGRSFEEKPDLHAMSLAWIYEKGVRHFSVYDEEGNLLGNGNSPIQKAFDTGERNGGAYKIEYRNGDLSKWIYYTCDPLLDEDGNATMVLATLTDITDQKQVEYLIRQSEQQLRMLAESIPQLVWMSDEKGNCEYKNGRWYEYSGLAQGDLDILMKIIHPDDWVYLNKVWSSCLATGEEFRMEVRLMHHGGEHRWHSVNGEPIRNADGEVFKWIGVFTDIHEQKTSSENLEMLVKQRTRELERSNEDLQQFAHVASHDLKEPLRKIKIYSGRIRDEFMGAIPSKAMQHLEKIEGAANRMFAMVEGVLQYSSLNSSLQQPEWVDLNDILGSIESDLEISIQMSGANVRYGRLPSIEGAPILVYQLLYNLLNNSLKFRDTGRLPVIRISAEMEEKEGIPYVKLVIEDNGIGFEQEYADKIFNSFSRLNPKDRYEGTGLGLALCKKIVERHHGSIEALGFPGVGSRFTIYLPVHQNGQLI
jgi:PAS domain S-box-containing protein